MTIGFSKTQIDRLGDRIRTGNIAEDDLRLLDQYRLSFSTSYETVTEKIKSTLDLKLTGRPAKSTVAIVAKLGRESIRLSQIQDIAGCRIIVTDVPKQELAIAGTTGLFADVAIIDRRASPSHGYRAVHLVVKHLDSHIEIQVRTALQHLWAELSEKFSDIYDPAIKYGGGNMDLQVMLKKLSVLIARHEEWEGNVAALESKAERFGYGRDGLDALLQSVATTSQDIQDLLRDMINSVKSGQ